jgi:thioredoxin 1
MTVHTIQTRKEYDDVLKNNAVVFLDAFAEWCGPCKMIAPKIEQISNAPENKDVYFAKFDVDEVMDVAAELEVTGMPTFYVFINGKKADEVVGVNPPKLIKALQMAGEESKKAAAAKAADAAGAKEAEAVGAEDKKPAEAEAEEKKPEEKAEGKKPEEKKLETDREDW